jgi:two-component system, NtrC family, response regulator HydG
MHRIVTLANRVASLDSTVLITGESGVGKERLARWIHTASPRRHGAFVAVNCAALPDTLLESELFGHVRGAYTGAVRDRRGFFEEAHRGTLFLDEIGEVSPATQVRLLRVLQEREVYRVGETRPRPIDVRLIAATNRDLEKDIRRQRFRRDLYYRLRVIDLHVPPLRERPEDLRLLTRRLLEQIEARLHRPVTGYAPAALDRLLDYAWPGNVRELEHAIERACAVADGPLIDVDDLPDAVRRSHPRRPHGSGPLIDHQVAYIRAVLDQHRGNRRLTAQELGISLSTLKRRLRRLNKGADEKP